MFLGSMRRVIGRVDSDEGSATKWPWGGWFRFFGDPDVIRGQGSITRRPNIFLRRKDINYVRLTDGVVGQEPRVMSWGQTASFATDWRGIWTMSRPCASMQDRRCDLMWPIYQLGQTNRIYFVFSFMQHQVFRAMPRKFFSTCLIPRPTHSWALVLIFGNFKWLLNDLNTSVGYKGTNIMGKTENIKAGCASVCF